MKHLVGNLGTNAHETVHTYGCAICLDQGLVLEERKTRLGYDAMYSLPCPVLCDYGKEVLSMFKKAIVDSVNPQFTRKRNRRARYVDVEVNDA